MSTIRFSGIHKLNLNTYPISNKPFERIAKREQDIVSQAGITVIGEKNGGGFSRIILTDQDARDFLKKTYPQAANETKALELANQDRIDASNKRSNGFFYKLDEFVRNNPKDASGNASQIESFRNEKGDRPELDDILN